MALSKISDQIIDVESIAEKVITCPRCGTLNRMFPQEKAIAYRCAKCHAKMGNPFPKASHLKQTLVKSAKILIALVPAKRKRAGLRVSNS